MTVTTHHPHPINLDAAAELPAARPIHVHTGVDCSTSAGRDARGAAPSRSNPHRFSLHSRPVRRIEIPQRFSSSLLPPSFAVGRCATFCIRLRAPRAGAGA